MSTLCFTHFLPNHAAFRHPAMLVENECLDQGSRRCRVLYFCRRYQRRSSKALGHGVEERHTQVQLPFAQEQEELEQESQPPMLIDV